MAKKTAPSSPLLYAASAQDPDQLYFGRMHVPDPFIAFAVRGRKFAVLSALEFARARKESAFDEVLSLEEWAHVARRRLKVERAGPAEIICALGSRFGIRRFRIPSDFPAGIAQRLRELRVRFDVVNGPFFPQREIKSNEEAAAIRRGNKCAAAGLRTAESVLRDSVIRRGRLYHQGRLLTSERLKQEIEIACLRQGAVSLDTIAAAGDQACDPHARGIGPIRANQLIIVDVFPRVVATGYYGDMTRTFLKGQASEAQRRLVETVRQGQQLALKRIRSGVTGESVHRAVSDFFDGAGYPTSRDHTGARGFFHGTGHGLGLAVHEPPRVSAAPGRLRQGHVVTVEPGLYYPGLGGCRIEDVVRVTADKPERLSSYPYAWEIR